MSKMKVKEKKCKQCWKSFVPYSSLDKYCSSKCKVKWEKEKEKVKKVKAREKKKTSPKKLYKDNVEMAKLIAKIRDWYICQWCWKDCNSNKSDCHWSHIINEARDHRLATDEYNIKALCFHCHMNLWHKDPVLASKWFNEKFPWRYDRLQELHIIYWKIGKIWKEWHIAENIRLKNQLNLLNK